MKQKEKKRKEKNKKEGYKAATIKLRNERGMIRLLAHPEAKKMEEQHHNAQHACALLLLALNWLLFELWGLDFTDLERCSSRPA
jgi:hypothetical protein